MKSRILYIPNFTIYKYPSYQYLERNYIDRVGTILLNIVDQQINEWAMLQCDFSIELIRTEPIKYS